MAVQSPAVRGCTAKEICKQFTDQCAFILIMHNENSLGLAGINVNEPVCPETIKREPQVYADPVNNKAEQYE